LLSWSTCTTNVAFVPFAGFVGMRSPVCFANRSTNRSAAPLSRASLCPVRRTVNPASIFRLPLPICTFAGTGMRFNAGINTCRFDGCVSCDRDGPLSDTLNIIRLNPLNKTLDFPIIVPPSP
jgi:hypothetical protein